ncbi:Kelch motif family protein [Histomonas meleagridis]|uniref:Kelch motif family protein n=1 Tax=Histomonas meleagridis TaxID=135588 RepID=UPI003559E797|nr:Kelch motif family protein [Histomonas meleagridis]KAH0796331.1 Kelch motif family protein [Histomonas meleagridis]
MGGVRLDNEKSNGAYKLTIPIPRIRKNYIAKTAFAGVWSLEQTESVSVPPPRTGQFSYHYKNKNWAITGFGIDSNANYYNDIWILDIESHQWTQLNTFGEIISPRSGSLVTIYEDILYIFGGESMSTFYNDFYAVNLLNGQTIKIISNVMPTPRCSGIFGSYDGQLFLWGGFNGIWPSELCVYDIASNQWNIIPQEIGGRSNVAYEIVDNFIYGYGSSKTGGLLIIDMCDKTVSIHPTTGPEPFPSITDGALVHFDEYLMFIGGKAPSHTMFIYGLNLKRFRWFVFHVLPDGTSVSAADGTINELGMFTLPRMYSMGAVYDNRKREILTFMGHPAYDRLTLSVVNVAEALGFLHLRRDMYEIIQ